MDLVALDYQKRKPHVQWQGNDELRIFLCCLYKFFEKDPKTFTEIFNIRFREELMKFGFTEKGVSVGTIRTQWEDMKRTNDPIWRYVHLAPFDQTQWHATIQQIRLIARTQRLCIWDKIWDDISDQQPTPAHSHTLMDQPEQPSSPQIPSAQETNMASLSISAKLSDQLDSPEPGLEESPLCTAGGKVCFWCFKEGQNQNLQSSKSPQNSQYIPPLLYRWFNVGSQGVNSNPSFVAGLFCGERAYFSPENIPQSEFDDHFLKHIKPEKTPSPFISTFKSLLAPVHRGLREGEGASVSIIDSTKILKPIYSAKNFVQEHNVKINTYRGFGEYLIWAEIPENAIICTFKISTLLRLASETPEISEYFQLGKILGHKVARRALHRDLAKGPGRLDAKTGATVGKLLSALNIPFIYSERVSEGIVYSWRMKRSGGLWAEYFSGVKRAYGGQFELTEIASCCPSSVYEISDDDEILSSGDEGIMKPDETDEELDGDSSTINSPCPRQTPEDLTSLESNDEVSAIFEDDESEVDDAPKQLLAQDQFAADRARVMSLIGDYHP